MYTEPLYLISHVDSFDSIGNVVRTETQKLIYARKKAVGSKEFYNATAVGITPTAELQIRVSNYNGEDEVIYNGQHYAVIRSVPIDRMDVVLVIGIKDGVN